MLLAKPLREEDLCSNGNSLATDRTGTGPLKSLIGTGFTGTQVAAGNKDERLGLTHADNACAVRLCFGFAFSLSFRGNYVSGRIIIGNDSNLRCYCQYIVVRDRLSTSMSERRGGSILRTLSNGSSRLDTCSVSAFLMSSCQPG